MLQGMQWMGQELNDWKHDLIVWRMESTILHQKRPQVIFGFYSQGIMESYSNAVFTAAHRVWVPLLVAHQPEEGRALICRSFIFLELANQNLCWDYKSIKQGSFCKNQTQALQVWPLKLSSTPVCAREVMTSLTRQHHWYLVKNEILWKKPQRMINH